MHNKKKSLIAFSATVLALAVGICFSNAVLADDNQGSVNPTAVSESEGSSTSNLYSYSNAWSNQAKEIESAFSNAFGNAVQSGVTAEQMPSSLSIDPSGQVRITGASLTAVSSGSATVNVWGLTFNVDTTQAQLAGPGEQGLTSSSLQVGDKLTITGTLNPTTGVISAKVIVDYSAAAQQATGVLQSRINQLLQLIQQLQTQLNAMSGTGAGAPATGSATSTSD